MRSLEFIELQHSSNQICFTGAVTIGWIPSHVAYEFYMKGCHGGYHSKSLTSNNSSSRLSLLHIFKIAVLKTNFISFNSDKTINILNVISTPHIG